MDQVLEMPSGCPQITTTIQLDGNQFVSFGSPIDWAESMSLKVESPDAQKCIERISEWLSGLAIYPWGNLADYQDYANATEDALKDPLIYAQIREYVLQTYSTAFTYLPMQIGYLNVAFTFRRVDLNYTLEEETQADIQNQIAAFDNNVAESEYAARQQAIKLTNRKFNFTINMHSTKMPFLAPDHTDENGVLVTGLKKPELRGELKDATVTELLSFLMTVGTTITAPDEQTTAVSLAQCTQAFTRLKERFFSSVPGVGSTFTENCELMETDEEHGLSIKVGVTLLD